MNELLGMLDALEAIILDAKKVPLTEKVVVEEARMIDVIDKIRSFVKSKGDVIKEKVEYDTLNEEIQIENAESKQVDASEVERELAKATKIKKGAQDYATFILSNLQLTVTKMQNNLIKLEKNIESGRDMIDKKNNEDNTTPVVMEETSDKKI